MLLRFAPHVLTILALSATAVPGHAAFINGDFSSSTLTTGGAITGTSTNGVWPGGAALDAGWIQSSDGLWSITAGEARRSLSTGVTNLYGLTQFVTDSKVTTGDMTLSFDYSIVIGTSQSTTYTIRYDVVGINTSSTSGSGGKITTTGTLLGASFASLGTGTLTGLAENTSDTVTGTISFGAGYNYVGIRLIGIAAGGSGSINNYIAFDNVSLAPVPEPGSLALLGLGSLLMLGGRSRRATHAATA